MAELIETIRVREGKIPLLGLHQERLARGAAALGLSRPGEFPLPDPLPVEAVLRWQYGPTGFGELRLLEPGPTSPLALVTSPSSHQPYPYKTTDREQFERALSLAGEHGADDALLATDSGMVAECAIWSLFWWRGGSLAAPPGTAGVLDSVSRARLAQICGGLVEEEAEPGEVARLGLFAANAARGVVMVASLDGVEVSQNVATAGLAQRFWA